MKRIISILAIILLFTLSIVFASPASPTGTDLLTPPELSQLSIKDDGQGSAWLQVHVSSPKEVRSTAFYYESVDGELGRFEGVVLYVSIDGGEWQEETITLDEGSTDRLEGFYRTYSVEKLHVDSSIKVKAQYAWSTPDHEIIYSDFSKELTSNESYDFNAHDWAKEELQEADKLGLIPEGFKELDLTQNITRKEFAYVAVKLWEKISGSTMQPGPKDPFTDTDDPEVLKAYNLEITNGTSETTFSPDELITREQMATMMTRALSKAKIDVSVDLVKVEKFEDDKDFHSWGKEAIYYMANKEIIKGIGDNQFGALGNATREQALLIAVRSVNNVK